MTTGMTLRIMQSEINRRKTKYCPTFPIHRISKKYGDDHVLKCNGLGWSDWGEGYKISARSSELWRSSNVHEYCDGRF